MSAETDIKKMMDKLKKVRDELESKKRMKQLGAKAAELIKKRTQLGWGVDKQGGKKAKLDKLSDGYKKFRKKNKPTGKSTPSKSNLTYSGDMLDDLEAKHAKDNKVTIGFSSTKSEKKAGWAKDGGREFNNLSKSEQKQLEQFLDEELKKILKKID